MLSNVSAARVKFITFGLIFGGAGLWSLLSDLSHARIGVQTIATVTSRDIECKAEFQRVGEDKSNDVMPCDTALLLEKQLGRSRFKVSQSKPARVRYDLPDGSSHEGHIEQHRLAGRPGLVGDQFAVKVDAAKPTDVRPLMGWQDVRIPLILAGVGVGLLAFAFIDFVFVFIAFLWRGGKRRAFKPSARTMAILNDISHAAPARPVSSGQSRPTRSVKTAG
jgi:hypothetical protein